LGGGSIPSELPLETEITLYNSLIFQLEHELAYSKGKERDLSERWNRSAQRVLDHQKKGRS